MYLGLEHPDALVRILWLLYLISTALIYAKDLAPTPYQPFRVTTSHEISSRLFIELEYKNVHFTGKFISWIHCKSRLLYSNDPAIFMITEEYDRVFD